IRYILPDGAMREVDVRSGQSVMEGARQSNIPGIIASCGGGCACATCHVYVNAAWVDRLPKPDDMEDEMLNFAFERDTARSRLTCQIYVTDELDGLTIEIP
ncbi:hypothetical protein Angca_004615, partial [Angiostrongylus cantonensis]